MIYLLLDELKLVAKSIKDYNKKILSQPKTKISLSEKKIRGIKENFNDLRYKFSKSKINEIRRSLYDIKHPKNVSKLKIKKIEKFC